MDPLSPRCHPQTPCRAVERFSVAARRDAALHVSFRLTGDLDEIVLPAPVPPAFADGLWQHTCFEVFVAVDGAAAYHEFNFSPSGQWAAYAFRAYRDRDPAAAPLPAPGAVWRPAGNRLALDATIALAPLSAAHLTQPLRLACAAVIELRDGTRGYWALRHPPGAPDFHHADAFALRLEAPGGE